MLLLKFWLDFIESFINFIINFIKLINNHRQYFKVLFHQGFAIIYVFNFYAEVISFLKKVHTILILFTIFLFLVHSNAPNFYITQQIYFKLF